MPHVNMKYFPPLNDAQKNELVISLTQTIISIVKCDEKAISIALEPIEKEDWYDVVYLPEIINRKNLLYKFPEY